MIKFFRKIRQKLLSEGKTEKYLKYSIGEIVLVVIGILIALQINNWNENRKERSSIKEYLTEVRENMVIDSLAMPKVIKRMQDEIIIQKEVIGALENNMLLDTSYNSKIGKCNTINGSSVTQTGYQNLKEIGLKKIKSKNIGTLLIKHYGNFVSEYEQQQEFDRNSMIDFWFPYIKDNFKDFKYRNYAIPKDYHALSKDSEFLLLLKINLDTRMTTLNSAIDLQNSSREIILLIDNELNK